MEICVLHRGLTIGLCQEQGSFTKTLFSKIKTVNMKIFLQARIF